VAVQPAAVVADANAVDTAAAVGVAASGAAYLKKRKNAGQFAVCTLRLFLELFSHRG
jgi:hypothetical protein